MSKKCRFAPSPTGNLHIGSVRTAIFNWVWAKTLGAALVLRIEDTDTERSTKSFEDNIIQGLDWLGISFDESPMNPLKSQQYRQSERIESGIYQPFIDQMLQSGDAYYCFETDDELSAERQDAESKGIPYMYSRKSLAYTHQEVQQKLSNGVPHTIRFKVPHGQTITVNDAIRGDVPFESSLISDFIIVRSDGQPTYNFVVVVDDVDMGITHVVRGEDHLSNTPKQIMLYNALNADLPTFAHLPIILGTDRSKLSKRHGATSVGDYQHQGFLPDAMLNYLSLLGWTPPDEKEILSRQELVDLFDVTKVNKAGAIFDVVKLTWMNKQYLSKLSDDEFLEHVTPFIHNQAWLNDDTINFKIGSVRDNCETLSQINTYLGVYFQSDDDVMTKVKLLTFSESDHLVLQKTSEILNQQSEWSPSAVQALLDTLMSELSLGKGKVMKPLRKAITGDESGPNLVDCLALHLLQTCQSRIATLLDVWTTLNH